MSFLRYLCILSCSIFGCVFSGQSILPPGALPIDPTRINKGVLSVPEIKGSLTAPAPEWKWYHRVSSKKPGREYYYCEGPEKQLFIIIFSPGLKQIRTAKIEFFRKDVEDLVRPSNGSILSEQGELISIPPHPEVFHMTSRVLLGENEVDYERYLLPTDSHMVMFCAVHFNDADRPTFKTFASTLTYASDSKFDPSAYFYFVWGGVLYVLGWLLNTVLRRSEMLPGAFAIWGTAMLIIARTWWLEPDPRQRPGEALGYQIGLALFPLMLFALIYFAERTYLRKAAARAAQRNLDARETEH